MSDLRKQLERARSEYESIRYNGNLAADVFRQRTHIVRRLFIAAAAMSAIAAAVALWMSIQPDTITTPNTVATVTTIAAPTTTNVEDEFSLSVPEVPTFPEGIQLMPTGEAMVLPSVPSFPTLQELEQDQATSATTSKEEV